MSTSLETEAHWLQSVIKDYRKLVRQWSALSTMIQSAPQHGWQVSLTPSIIPGLSVCRVLPSSQQPTGAIGSYTSSRSCDSGTINSSWPKNLVQGILPVQELLSQIPTGSTTAPSSTSKPATCHSRRKPLKR